MPPYFSGHVENGLRAVWHLWPVWVVLPCLFNLKKCPNTSTQRMLWADGRQRRKTGLLFESSLNHIVFILYGHFKCDLEILCPLYAVLLSQNSFCSCSHLTFWHKLMLRWRAKTLALGFIFGDHLAHSQFWSGPLWKWHTLLFGLLCRTVPLLLFSSGDYWSNLSRINGEGEGIPFVQWEQEKNWGRCRRNASDISITMSFSV